MSDYTTIQISKDTLEKLVKIKKEKRIKYDTIIKQLLELHGGTILEDVVTINRESIALSLKYYEEDSNKVNVYDITYHDLRVSKIGAKFTANVNPAVAGFVNMSAKVIYKHRDDVILLLEELHCTADGEERVFSNVVHVKMF